MSRSKKKLKNKRLNCLKGNKQCGGTCIQRSENCHKGKAALFKSNVKKEISRVENGGDFGKVSNKAIASMLINDRQIGQKFSPKVAKYVAKSNKLDDRVKKAYIDSATKPKYNYDGTAEDVKLSKPDKEFTSKIRMRAFQSNQTSREKPGKDEDKKFWQTDEGKNFLKAVGIASLIGAGAIGTSLYVTSKKPATEPIDPEKDIPFGVEASGSEALKQSQKTYVSPEKTRQNVIRTEGVRQSLGEEAAQQMSQTTESFAKPSIYNEYTDTYKSALRINKRRKTGNMSKRDESTFEEYWGFSPDKADANLQERRWTNAQGTVTTKKVLTPTDDSFLGKARQDVIDDLRKKGYTDVKDQAAVIAFHQNPKNWKNIKKGGNLKWDDESKTYVLPKQGAYDKSAVSPGIRETFPDEMYVTQKFPKSYEAPTITSEKLEGKAAVMNRSRRQTEYIPAGETSEGYIRDIDKISSEQKDIIAKRTESEELLGIRGGEEDLRYTPEKNIDTNKSIDPTTQLESSAEQRFDPQKASELNSSEIAAQKTKWEKMGDARKQFYIDASIAKNYGISVDEENVSKENHIKILRQIKENLQDPSNEIINDLRNVERATITNAIFAGNAVLPEYRSQTSANELGTSKLSRDEQKYENVAGEVVGETIKSTTDDVFEYYKQNPVGNWENKPIKLAADIYEEKEARESRSKTRGKGVLTKIPREYEREVKPGELPKFQKTSGGTEQVVSKSGNYLVRRKRGNKYVYYWKGKELPVSNANDVIRYLRNMDDWDFAEQTLEPFVEEILEENNGIIICSTDEGLIAYDFSSDLFRMVYL